MVRLPRIALVGVTGYGGIYLRYVRQILNSKEGELTAAVIVNCDQVPDIVSELSAAGTTIYDTTDEFFASERGRIDLCLIPVGIQWHARLTISALRAGMNVLVEKPLAGSLEDAAAIRRAELATGHWVAVGFQDLYTQEARLLKDQLAAGVIGRVEDVRVIGLWPRPRSYFSRNHWAGRARADGAAVHDSPLNNAFAHFINLALFLVGDQPDSSSLCDVQSVELHRAHDIEMFDTAVVRGASSDGIRFWFGVSHATAEIREPEIHFIGSQGRAEWLHGERRIVIHRADDHRVLDLPPEGERRYLMFKAVLDRVRKPDTFICTTGIAEAHAKFIENVQEIGSVQPYPPQEVRWYPDHTGCSEAATVDGLAIRLQQAMDTSSTLASTASVTQFAVPECLSMCGVHKQET